MALKSRRTVLLAKKEVTYGQDAAPTGASDAILVRNVTLTPLETKMEDRTVVRPYYGANEQLPGPAYASIEFEVEMAGAGAAGTAPAYGKILKACGMSETINAGVSVVYSPISTDGDALTIYYYLDGVLHKVLGSRGSMSFKLNAGASPTYSFKFQGMYVAVTDVSLPSVTLTAYQRPLTVTNANTTAFSLHGVSSLVMNALDVDLGSQVVHRDNVGAESVIITDRQVAGNVTIESALMAVKNWFTTVQTAALGALTVTHGTTAGNKVKLDAPSVQLTGPKYSDSDGVSMLQMGMRLLPVSGNDELTITVL